MCVAHTSKKTPGKRGDFQKFLEKAGIVDLLTNVIADIFEQLVKPESVTVFVIDKLSREAGLDTYTYLKAKYVDTLDHLKTADKELEVLKARLSKLQCIEAAHSEGEQEI
ncbi:unnamed protein product [Psylliodes chrysocephalus]|uniref:Uncharacterized protein n=1 Tax=Psylliodes chrysocephalus TaxID=3402493 RepID=A0A9P0GLJ1_9CUCU|nr:unnamed protein product [Psylliodes chrysocephala]